MSSIEVPYMPVESFEATDFVQNSEETPPNDSEKLTNDLFPTEYTMSGDILSENISLILIGMGMEKYIKLFQKESIPIDTFLQLTDADLQEIGITDPKDRETIIKNLSVHGIFRNKYNIPDNQLDDLKIIKNVSNQLLLMQKYCAYVELQMRKHKLTDYMIDKNEYAGTYLKAFTGSALIQSQILKEAIYDEKNFDALINKLLKVNNLTLPKTIENEINKIHKRHKNKIKLFILKVVVTISFPIVILYTGRYIFNKCQTF